MNYRFVIQSSQPHSLGVADANDVSVSDAMQTVFPLETEHALMCFNSIYVPLTYKYDLSEMIQDVFSMTESIAMQACGSCVIDWPSNTFASRWSLAWGNGIIELQSEWRSVIGSTEALLEQKSALRVEISEFLAEWRRPLEVIREALDAAGYREIMPREIERIDNAISRIPRRGVLYRT